MPTARPSHAHRTLSRTRLVSSMVADHTAFRAFALALGRLRASVRARPGREEEALALACDVGRHAHAAGVPLALLVDNLAALVPGTAPDTRAFPARVIDAAASSYLDTEAAEQPGDPSRASSP